MIRRPALTPAQRKRFEEDFISILDKAPELKRIFTGIIWNDITDQPFIQSEITEKLPIALKDRYVTLLNKLRDRSL